MRLINTTTLELHTFYNRTIPRYATLSHCWAEDEVSLEDFNAGARDKAGFKKISNVCRLAKEEYDLDFAWVDTCCIDKSSSAELSESINSMYLWYQKSVACYVFLDDVDIEGAGWMQEFADARWFTRGWTLQELLAPLSVRFFDKNLQFIDTREGLAKDISRITRIPETLLRGMWSEYRTTSVAHRMSWASHRQTTREEDMAYCLLGLFDVNMPLLYGEGKKAFRRLQEHIISSSTDDSVFAWISNEASDEVIHGDGLLACSPKDFAHSGNIVSLASTARPPTTVTNKGVQVHYAITDPGDLICHAVRWFINITAFPKTIHLDLNCAQQTNRKPLQWITIPLESRATYDDVYHRKDSTFLLRRQVNLSVGPRLYAGVYVGPRDALQENHDLRLTLRDESSVSWLSPLQAVITRPQIYSFLVLTFVVDVHAFFGYHTDAFAPNAWVRKFLFVLYILGLTDVVLEAAEVKNRAWHRGLVCLTVMVFVGVPLPLMLAAAFILGFNVNDVLVPYTEFRPGSRN